MNAYCRFALGAVLGGVYALSAQTVNPLSAEVKWSYGSIKNNLLKLAEKMPAEDCPSARPPRWKPSAAAWPTSPTPI